MKFYSGKKKISIIIMIIVFLLNNFSKADDKFVCIKEILNVEKHLKLPKNLLLAISLTETGRLVDNMYIPWPWAVNVKGKGSYLNNKQELKKLVLTNIQHFTKNVDIGCMQINYYYHGDKFKIIDDMINPRINVLYAGHFLIDLRNKYGSWKEAIMRYHSSNLRRKRSYYKKVLNNWSFLGSDFKTTKVNKKYKKVMSFIEDTIVEDDNKNFLITEKYAIEEDIINSGGYSETFISNDNDNLTVNYEMPKISEELLFINEFTYMSKEDIINNLERLKELKK